MKFGEYPMPSTPLPSWFAWVQLLTPAFIALIALIVTAWIQIGQKRIARNKLKLDLFDKRYELLTTITRMIKLANRSSEDFLFEMSKEYENFRKSGLLFPQAISDKVDELVRRCHECQGLLQETKDLRGSAEVTSANQRFRKSQAELERLFLDLQVEITEFIRVDWKG